MIELDEIKKLFSINEYIMDKTFGLVFVSIPLVPLIIYSFYKYFRLIFGDTVVTKGTVVRVKFWDYSDGSHDTIYIEFKDTFGNSFELSENTNPLKYKIGDIFSIIYPRDNPSINEIYVPIKFHGRPFLSLLGYIILLLGIYFTPD